MAELLAISVTLNLFVIWRFINLHRIHHMTMRLLFDVAHGRTTIRVDDEGLHIKTNNTNP
jgi:hypothetical protein